MDIIMSFGTVVFFVLFAFLLFIFNITIISFFKKKKTYEPYEPFVSILVPVYNEQDRVKPCIDALHNLTYPKQKIEIIFIDDGSTDGTYELLQKTLHVTVLQQDHLGKTHALNKGAQRATGECIITVDVDTLIEPHAIEHIVRPLADKQVAATSGAVVVQNKTSLAGMFQNIEYHMNNIIRRSFSHVFDTGIWFFGCFACYRATTLRQIGYFKTDTMCEDMDSAMEIRRLGFKTINVPQAVAHTDVPTTLKDLYMQRSRWWIGGMQSLLKNWKILKHHPNLAVIFLYVNHFWWAWYGFVSLPLFIYQMWYWFPEAAGAVNIFMYFFRWFTLIGPVYVLYMLPVWGLSVYNIFGVISGLLSTTLIVISIILYKDKISWRNALVIFLYFPYTIILNLIVAASVLRWTTLKNKHFIK